VWDHLVSLDQLLIRSAKSPEFPDENIDVIFMGVNYLNCPTHFAGLTLDMVEPGNVSPDVPEEFLQPETARLYRLKSQGQSYAIVAVACYVFTNTRDAFESPFAQGVQSTFDEWGEKLLFTLK